MGKGLQSPRKIGSSKLRQKLHPPFRRRSEPGLAWHTKLLREGRAENGDGVERV